MNRGAVKYIIKLLLQRVLGLLIFLLGSCWIFTFRAAVYFSFYFATTILSCVVMYRVNPVTLAERNKANTDSPKWDKILLGLYWILAFFVIYLVAGLESGRIPQEVGLLFWIGIALQVFVTALTLWTLSVNTFLESTARIQNDRRQTVCRNGPYKFIRHPTYEAVL